MQSTQIRRLFLSTLSSAGVAGFIGAGPSLAQERPPETTAVRLAKIAGICIAPQYVADELTDVSRSGARAAARNMASFTGL
jgi:NitT/TauT family transport system substrate-binding protein